jgi:hypothetical protein
MSTFMVKEYSDVKVKRPDGPPPPQKPETGTPKLAILINDEKGDTVFSRTIETTTETRAIFLTQLRHLLEMMNEFS